VHAVRQEDQVAIFSYHHDEAVQRMLVEAVCGLLFTLPQFLYVRGWLCVSIPCTIKDAHTPTHTHPHIHTHCCGASTQACSVMLLTRLRSGFLECRTKNTCTHTHTHTHSDRRFSD